jgi:hypothetical protein
VKATLAAALCAVALPAQAPWTFVGGDTSARVQAGAEPATLLRGPRATHDDGPTGDCKVTFAADALGRPLPLAFAVAPADRVQLAIWPVGPAATTPVPLDGDGWQPQAGEWNVRTRVEGASGSQCVSVRTTASDGTTGLGLVVRWRSPENWCRCVWDLEQGELRYERCLGGRIATMARTPLPADRREHALALQVTGFRVQAFVDDVPAFTCFDGGSAPGAYGTSHRGVAPQWNALALAEPSQATASIATVRSAGATQLYAALPWSPGQTFVLELALDRPHPLVLAPNGFESLFLLRPAAPQVVLADWSQRLGRGSVGQLARDGLLHCELPATASGLAGQAALVRVLAIAGGEVVVDASPPVAIHW